MKNFCESPTGQWLTGLTLIVIGGVILLQKLEVLAPNVWSWVWPILVLIWGVIFLYQAGAKR